MEFTKMRSLYKIEDIYAKQSKDDSAQNKGMGSIYVLGQCISIPQGNPLGIGATASLTPAQTQSIDSLDYVGNFIYEKGQLKRYMFDDGYLRLNTNNTCVPRFFIKDYDFEMHNPLNPLNWPRNIETIIGKSVAGNGKPFEINIYGSKKLTPILPWIK